MISLAGLSATYPGFSAQQDATAEERQDAVGDAGQPDQGARCRDQAARGQCGWRCPVRQSRSAGPSARASIDARASSAVPAPMQPAAATSAGTTARAAGPEAFPPPAASCSPACRTTSPTGSTIAGGRCWQNVASGLPFHGSWRHRPALETILKFCCRRSTISTTSGLLDPDAQDKVTETKQAAHA